MMKVRHDPVSTLLSFKPPLPEDELQNIDIAEREQDEKRNTLKTKRRDYTGYDDEEFTGTPGMRRAVLSKYDEDIEGSAKAVSLFGLEGLVADNLQFCPRNFVWESLSARLN